ncbi:hypothetical protein LCGC14_1175020 [marine sediment metagenome]|uniref:Uncharacterized protein n=1 Tax=marine sediment metagenome TaxID=412755 RepID=A0A0F9PU68_9ZZZZ|nr:hypothetical protein [bacterium]
MVNFYFVDSNIIMGYCNPEDTFHDVANGFFNEKPSRQILLLFSIQEEYLRKIEDERAFFYNEIIRKIKTNDFPTLQSVIQRVQSQQKFMNNNFIKFFLSLIKKKGITYVSFTILQDIFSEYSKNLRDQFNNLTQNWIKKPHMTDHTTIFKDKIFLHYFNKLIANHVHQLDARHLALAAYALRTNRKNRNHQFYFYTNDKDWIKNALEIHINIRNFKIIRIPYSKSKSLGYNPLTKSFNVVKFKYFPDNI